jgi:DNA-binding GntR family transcriptional regulator
VPSSVDPAGNQRWSRAHAVFHAACVAACGSPRLVATQYRLYDEAEVLRQMSDMSGGMSRDVEGEHAAIAEAITTRDADRAVELIRRHVEITAGLSVKAALARTESGDS